jgi:hypothetical protein
MTTEQFRKAWKAEPFRPFILKTGSGALYPVNHPEMVMITGAGRTIAVADASGADAVTILDLLLVEAIEVPAQAAGR